MREMYRREKRRIRFERWSWLSVSWGLYAMTLLGQAPSPYSPDYKEIQNYIIHDLKRGATLYVAQGAYDEKHRTELVTILAQQEYRLLLNYLHTTKKDVFVTVSTVNEVIGQWNAK